VLSVVKVIGALPAERILLLLYKVIPLFPPDPAFPVILIAPSTEETVPP